MKIKLFLAGLLILGVSGCGGGSSGDTATPGQPTVPGAASSSTQASSDSGGGGGGGTVSAADCAKVKQAVTRLTMSTQYVAQLGTVADFEQLAKSGTVTPGQIKFDLDQAVDDVKALKVLDGIDARPYGKPDASIAHYEAAFTTAQQLVKSTPTQAQVDDFKANKVGPLQDWIKLQLPISGAATQACP